MPWANLYSVKYDPDTKQQVVEMVEGYRKKKHDFTSNPKPIQLKDGKYIVYVWASTSKFAALDANRIFDKYLSFPGGDE